MGNLLIIFKRELLSYFATPLAYIFIVIFLVVNGFLTFDFGGFYARGQADLAPFFAFHPFLYLFMVPAIAMTMWADERKSGTIELLLTLPINLRDAILGKYLAAWTLIGIALFLTFPIWITANYLGNPDNGIIFAAYVGSWCMAGAYLAIGACLSACTKNPVIAFILTVTICVIFVLLGYPFLLGMLTGWVPQIIIDAISSMGFLTHFDSISKGVLDVRDFLFFGVFIAAWLFASAIIIELKKAS